MNKKPFVTKEQIEEIAKTYPTPFHLYDEKGIRENAKRVKEAFSAPLARTLLSSSISMLNSAYSIAKSRK